MFTKDFETLVKTFVGRKADKYISKFNHFTATNQATFAPTWHWPAFFFTRWWFLYRKMYVWFLVVVLIEFIPLGWFSLIKHILCGLLAYYLYFRHSLQKIGNIQQAFTNDDGTTWAGQILFSAEKQGGVHRWIIVVGILVWLILITLILLVGLVEVPVGDINVDANHLQYVGAMTHGLRTI